MLSPPLRTSLGRSSSSRRLAAGNDHDVQLLRTVPSPFWWLPAADCVHLMVERWPERTDTMTLALTVPAADTTSVPWHHQSGWLGQLDAAYSDYCQLICRLQQHGADRWNAVCTVTMAYIWHIVPRTEYDSYVVWRWRRLHGINRS